ncbi:MAG TPA: class I SAM-dependent methyltransferase [Verrucomicrobiae bacterium]|nr:class I SAM-dependent methyltransferase [Verrucomicrobiae bacterium]
MTRSVASLPVRRFWLRCTLAATLSVSWVAASLAQELSKLPYVPTPQIVVDEMLKLANVTAKDFVIDLGSGDGRMIITAARNFKANGLGVDIDAKLVQLSNKQAKADGVDERVKFIEQDMFATDISKATVVTLYVLPDFMEKLRPKLLAELKPGSRIVAHDYYMSDWYPDRQLSLTVPEKVKANGTDKAYLYLWVVPAVVAGRWRMEFDVGGNNQQPIGLIINQQFQILNASAENVLGPTKVENPILKGDEISFNLAVGANRYQFTGKVSDGKMEGIAVSSPGSKPITWRAGKLQSENN